MEDGVLRSIHSQGDADLPKAALHRDYPGALLAPAYLDVHTHGCRGRDVMEATSEALGAIGRFLPQHGVGAYLPTTITAPKDVTLRSLAGLARLLRCTPEPGHARPLGIHLEGPFLSHAKRGAHPTADLLAPSIPWFDTMWEAAEGRITLMTIAPEVPGAIDLITHAVAKGVRISIGHSDGLAADAARGIAAGATSATHAFNAMRRLDHREPGILGAVLTTDTLYSEIICDGLHVEPSIVRLFFRAKPADRVILITDAMSAAGMPDGNYKLGALDVRVSGGRAITGEDTLAGSTLVLDAAVRKYREFTGGTLEQSVRAASENPARMSGWSDELGSLAEGRRADVNVLTPSGDLIETYIGGMPVTKQK